MNAILVKITYHHQLQVNDEKKMKNLHYLALPADWYVACDMEEVLLGIHFVVEPKQVVTLIIKRIISIQWKTTTVLLRFITQDEGGGGID